MEENSKALTDAEAMHVIEAILFAMGGSVGTDDLAAVLELPEGKILGLIHDMQRLYEKQKRGVMIRELENAVQMCTVRDAYPWLIKLVSRPKKPVLTDTVMETLSIIAYKQPVTRADIERIRGVSSDHAVNRLVEFGLVEEKGRLDAPGKPILFGTTEEFLRLFDISTPNDLPVADEEMVEEFRREAEDQLDGRAPAPQAEEEAEDTPSDEAEA